MVGKISWFSQRRRIKTNSQQLSNSRWIIQHEKPEALGILAFDTTKTISRLISLYKSLSNDQITFLKEHIIQGKGIAYLTSKDERFLLTLACAEYLEDLDRSASVVARQALKCSDYNLVRFEHLYNDLKNGYVDMDKYTYGSKEIEKQINKLEKLVVFTMELYEELESLSELEASERKLNEWRKSNNNDNVSYEMFDQKIANQRKLVRHLKEVSLWGKSHDKIVGRMAKIVCVLCTRICSVFGCYVSILPYKNDGRHEHKKIYRRNLSQQDLFTEKLFDIAPQGTSISGPIPGACPKAPLVRFLNGESNVFIAEKVELQIGQRHPQIISKNNRVFQAAPMSTVGGAGLALRYANLILLVERYLNSKNPIGDQSRHYMYNLLPTRLKTYIRSKLRVRWREMGYRVRNVAFAEGWREAVDEMLEWLIPMAQDTLTWQAERSTERQRLYSRPTVLLLQTLHYANLEKTDFAIAEVLSCLSCICWCGNRRVHNGDNVH